MLIQPAALSKQQQSSEHLLAVLTESVPFRWSLSLGDATVVSRHNPAVAQRCKVYVIRPCFHSKLAIVVAVAAAVILSDRKVGANHNANSVNLNAITSNQSSFH